MTHVDSDHTDVRTDLSGVERLLLDRLTGATRPDTIQPRIAAGPTVTSYGQQQLWLMDQINPESREYMVPEALLLRGPLDVEALRAAFIRLAERHEILRTSFDLGDEGVLVQTVEDTPSSFFTVVDPPNEDSNDLQAVLEDRLGELTEEPFDLSRGPLIRVALTRLGRNKHLLTVVMHHIICDGWSFGVMSRELPVLYASARDEVADGLDPLSIQYADFSAWQRSEEQTQRFERQASYWHKRLAGLSSLELPQDYSRPPIRTGEGDAVYTPLSTDLVGRVEHLSRDLRVTPYMIYLAAFQVLLSGRTGVEDVVVGTPVAGRNLVETENLLGFFVNTVVIRTDLSGDPSFAAYLARVREVCLDSFSHQDVPFGRLVDELCRVPDLSRTPLYQHTFIYNAGLGSKWNFPDLDCDVLPTPLEFAKSDLSVTVSEVGTGWKVRVEYSTDLFKRSTARRISDDYLRLLRSAVDQPEAILSELLGHLSPHERESHDQH